MLSRNLAKIENVSPYIFTGTKNDGSDTLRTHKIKVTGFSNSRDFEFMKKRFETARKFAAHFNLPGTIETKSDIVALVCKICELKYGTDYLSKSRHKAAIDGRAYIAWILRTFFEFTFSEIGAILNKDHSTIIHIYQKFDGFVGISRYPEYKLAAALRRALAE